MCYPAVYNLYTMMEASSNKIIASELVRVSSLHLDSLVMEGLIVCAIKLTFTHNTGDRHYQVR